MVHNIWLNGLRVSSRNVWFTASSLRNHARRGVIPLSPLRLRLASEREQRKSSKDRCAEGPGSVHRPGNRSLCGDAVKVVLFAVVDETHQDPGFRAPDIATTVRSPLGV